MDNESIDKDRRRFLTTAMQVVGGLGAAFTAVPFLSTWWPSAKAEAAGAPVELDIGHIEPGQQITIEWRGKPVWVIRRTPESIENLTRHDNRLRDPQSLASEQPAYAQNPYRSIKKDFLVLVGVCTHLGCSPKYRPELGDLGKDWPGGFYCPCHGSTFDLAGRVFKGVPAPINMEVPPYNFIDEKTIVIGVDHQAKS